MSPDPSTIFTGQRAQDLGECHEYGNETEL